MTTPNVATPPPERRPLPTRSRRRGPWWRRTLKWVAIVGTVAVLGSCAAFAVVYAAVDLPPMPRPPEGSVVLDVNGKVIATFSRGGTRKVIDLDAVAPVVVKALIASEDRHFYDHGGVDPIGTSRALVNNLRGGQLQGGSTITQQLVKNSYLTQERSLRRKVKEAVLAIKLDRREDKEQILEQYLNTVYFGRGVYGIEAAAQEYFGIPAKRLRVAQAALLIGLLRSPEHSEPSRHPDEATRERKRVLDAMADTHEITHRTARAAAGGPLAVRPARSRVKLQADVSPFFVEWVRQLAIRRFGAEAVYGAGLRITTTLDLQDQLYAEAAVQSVLDQPTDPQAALVALDKSGAVRAYVGGRDYKALKVDLARGRAGGGSGRQAGSTFKPFVLATALAERIPLSTRFPGPPHIELSTGSGPWNVDNYGSESFGDIDLLEATAHSVNTVYAQLMERVGPAAVAKMATSLGITAEVPKLPSIALGTAEVSVLDMADAYLTFAREGSHVTPYAISKVTDAGGEVVYQHQQSPGEQALAQGTARAVTRALTGVIQRGTGTAARLDRPVAGKTGTTQGSGDAWFAGYTPEYAAVVWMGYPEGPQHAMTNVHGRSVTGGSFPAQIWERFMSKALTDVPKTSFADPPQSLLEGGSQTRTGTTTTSGPPRSTTSTSSTTTTTTRPKSTTTTASTVPEPTVVPTIPPLTTVPPPTTTSTSSTTTPAAEPAGAPPP